METKELVPLPENAQLPDIVRYEISTGQAGPDVAERMLQLQIAWEKREAEKEFIAARARLEFPAITKRKRSLNSHYASWDKIQEIIEPILKSEGFTLSFTSGQPNEQGLIPITGKLSHKLGHSETGVLYQPIGAVSKGMNANQAMGSAISYGQRYCAAMMLNLRFVDMDDDAGVFSTIDERQILTIQKLIQESKMDAKSTSQFLEWAGKTQGSPVKAIGDILQGEPYAAAFNMLLKKRRKVQEKAEK